MICSRHCTWTLTLIISKRQTPRHRLILKIAVVIRVVKKSPQSTIRKMASDASEYHLTANI